MKTLGIPFTEQQHIFPADRPSYSDFRKFSPTGVVPVLDDGDQKIWDSLGIALYLGDRHDGVWPSEASARSWAQCTAAEMHSGFFALRNTCGMNVGIRAR